MNSTRLKLAFKKIEKDMNIASKSGEKIFLFIYAIGYGVLLGQKELQYYTNDDNK